MRVQGLKLSIDISPCYLYVHVQSSIALNQLFSNDAAPTLVSRFHWDEYNP